MTESTHEYLIRCATRSADVLTEICEKETGRADPTLVLIATPGRCVSAATMVDRDGLIRLVRTYLEAIENHPESVRAAS